MFETGNHPAVSKNEATVTPALPETSTILASLGQAAFVWDLATDAIAWSDHAGAVFSDIPAASLASGAEFAKLIEPQRTIRSDALLNSPAAPRGEGAPYRIECQRPQALAQPGHGSDVNLPRDRDQHVLWLMPDPDDQEVVRDRSRRATLHRH